MSNLGDSSARRRRPPRDEVLPPPPVSPPRVSRSGANGPPGYEPPTPKKGQDFREANLPRRVPDDERPTKYRLARCGEKMAGDVLPPLYDIWGSSYKALDEFGIGVGLYYRQLMGLGVVILICALIYIPSMVHNASFQGSETPFYLTGTAFNATRDDLSLANNGIPDLIVTLLLCLFALAMWPLEKNAVKEIDTSQQTPQDYSICVHSPPSKPGLADPETYYKKFKKYGNIVFITVCLNNGNLMKGVATKRVLEHKLRAIRAYKASLSAEEKEKANRKQSDLSAWKVFLQRKVGMFATEDYLKSALEEQKKRLDGLSRRGYEPKRVYVTFEKEEAQRACLEAVATGLWEEKLHKFKNQQVNEEAKLGGKICRIDEAEEPTEVYWEHIDTTIFRRMFTWMIASFFSVVFLSVAFVVIFYIANQGWWAGIIIALVNAILPLVIRVLTLAMEEHKSLTHVQASMMLKLVVARGINTGVILLIITEYENLLKEAALVQILGILIADAFTTPFLRLTNVPDLIGRYLVAPNQKTQGEMDVFFQGAPWNLAERYTDMIKTVFVGLFYSAIVPTGLFVTAVAMLTLYWVDKYSLLRLWRIPPAYDASLSSYARKYIVLCIWIHLLMARIFFAYWPNEDKADKPDCNLFFCHETEGATSFSDDQKRIVYIYEVLGILVFAMGGGFLLLYYLKHYATVLVTKKHNAIGDASPISYRTVKGIDAYVPLISPKELTDPLLAIDVTDLPQNAQRYLPLRIDGYYDATELSMNSERDFPNVLKEDRDKLFGTVKYYPEAGEAVQHDKTRGGFHFEATVENQYSFRPGDILGIPRQASIIRQQSFMRQQSFKPPTGRIQEDRGPQRLPRTPTQLPSRLGTLPDGWEERTTGEGRPYYVCHDTRTSQWERPTEASNTRNAEVHWEDLHNASRDLPPGWELRYADDGRPYYVDHNRQRTHWEHPGHVQGPSKGGGVSYSSSLDPTEGGTRIAEQYTAAGLKYYVNPRTQQTQWSPPKARIVGREDTWGQQHTARVGGVDATVDRASSALNGLPEGWEKRTIAGGRDYYVNHAQRITQWNPPDGIRTVSITSATGEFKAEQGQQGAVGRGPQEGYGYAEGGTPGDGSQAGGRPASDLPAHIEQRWAPDGRVYYQNRRTQATSWARPPPEDW